MRRLLRSDPTIRLLKRSQETANFDDQEEEEEETEPYLQTPPGKRGMVRLVRSGGNGGMVRLVRSSSDGMVRLLRSGYGHGKRGAMVRLVRRSGASTPGKRGGMVRLVRGDSNMVRLLKKDRYRDLRMV